jgi:hypothetical protein
MDLLLTRRAWLGACVGKCITGATRTRDGIGRWAPPVLLFKQQTCACCERWADHMRERGFDVTSRVAHMGPLKSGLRIPKDLWGCHTALIGPYLIEGHVPGDVVEQLLNERPRAVGIAVPKMPFGSPGMDHGERHESYAVLLIGEDGSTSIYAQR